jgi:hypothetical protein
LKSRIQFKSATKVTKTLKQTIIYFISLFCIDRNFAVFERNLKIVSFSGLRLFQNVSEAAIHRISTSRHPLNQAQRILLGREWL